MRENYIEWIGVKVVVVTVERCDYWNIDYVNKVDRDKFCCCILFCLVIDMVDMM